jgi:CheY-like chemotaxis protein
VSLPSRSLRFVGSLNLAVTKKRILLLEDLADYCSLVGFVLSDFEIVCAGSAGEAVQIIQSQEKFDLYLVDYHLPDGNGFALCTILRTIDHTTPILLLASNGVLHRDAIAAGAQGLVRNQHLASQLPKVVSELLG